MTIRLRRLYYFQNPWACFVCSRSKLQSSVSYLGTILPTQKGNWVILLLKLLCGPALIEDVSKKCRQGKLSKHQEQSQYQCYMNLVLPLEASGSLLRVKHLESYTLLRMIFLNVLVHSILLCFWSNL